MEILENTLIRLISRQGADSDRINTLLNSGEFGYTTDLRRLHIGDGFTMGGVLVGNKFLGSSPDVTTLSPGLSGDLAFDPVKNKLYQLQLNNGSLSTDWKLIGGVYNTSNDKITITDNNYITLNSLSANSFSNDAVSGLVKIENGRITVPPLSANSLSNNLVSGSVILNNGRLGLAPLSANSLSNDLVSGSVILNNGRLGLAPLSANSLSNDLVSGSITLSNGRLALSANIPYRSVSTKTITVLDGLNASVDGLDVTGMATQTLSSNITIKSNQISVIYDGLSASPIRYSRNLTSAATLSTGHYVFNYSIPISNNPYPVVNIIGINNINGIVRCVGLSNTQCHINVFDSLGTTKVNSDIVLTISY